MGNGGWHWVDEVQKGEKNIFSGQCVQTEALKYFIGKKIFMH